MISLSQAIREDMLEKFIEQQEAAGTGPISEAEFDETASTVIKTPLPDDQTSGLLRRDDEDIEGEE